MNYDYEAENLMQVASETDSFAVERYKQFARFLPKGCSRVLDVGCNTGRGENELKNLRPELLISGVDCVQSRLDRLPPAYEEKMHGFSTEIPCESGRFDAVTAGEFIEHLLPQDVEQTLYEFFRVLKLGGRILLTTPNPSGFLFRLRKMSVLGGSHQSQHYADCLKLRLRMIGFSRVKVYGSGKSSRYLGFHFPCLNAYGSYLITADKF
jgi:ubiquinone/menaquinone biosynthesis C-methylase UbiE